MIKIKDDVDQTSGNRQELEKRIPTATLIAPELVAAVARGDYAIVDGRLESQICLAAGLGASPKRGWGVWDGALGFLVWVIWPFVRWMWERDCLGEAYREERQGGEERRKEG